MDFIFIICSSHFLISALPLPIHFTESLIPALHSTYTVIYPCSSLILYNPLTVMLTMFPVSSLIHPTQFPIHLIQPPILYPLPLYTVFYPCSPYIPSMLLFTFCNPLFICSSHALKQLQICWLRYHVTGRCCGSSGHIPGEEQTLLRRINKLAKRAEKRSANEQAKNEMR